MALDSPEGTGAAGIAVSAASPGLVLEGRAPAAIGPWRLAFRRLRRNYVALFFLAVLVVIVVLCVLAPVYSAPIADIGPNTNSVNGTQQNIVSLSGVPIGPTWGAHYLLGADTNGRDLAVRLLYGGRTSLLIGAIATAIIMILGTIVGLLAGYLRGVVDFILRPLMELIWSFPVVILGVALGTALALGGIGPIKGNPFFLPAVISGVVSTPPRGKPIRGEFLRVREQDFIDAARVQ